MALLGLRDPVGRRGEDVIEDAEHMVVRTDLFLAARVFLVLFLLRDLVEHLCEEEVEASIALDSVLEGLESRVEFFLVAVGFINQAAESLLMSSVVLREPCAGAVDVVLVGNA